MRKAISLGSVALLAAAAVLGWSAFAETPNASADEPFFTVVPASHSGPVGRSHTVTALPEIRRSSEEVAPSVQIGIPFTFEIVAGPNAGLSSASGGCNPANCMAGLNFETSTAVSWTYFGHRPGTDLIEVCATLENGFNTQVNGSSRECVRVTKTWVDGGFPLGGNIADQARENRERVAAAAQPAPAVSAPRTGTGVTPPNTGDAGLAASSESPRLELALAGLALLALSGVAGVRLTKSRA